MPTNVGRLPRRSLDAVNELWARKYTYLVKAEIMKVIVFMKGTLKLLNAI